MYQNLLLFVLLLSPSELMLPLPRSDSPPLLDKVGLTEEHGAPQVWRLGRGGVHSLSTLSLYMSKTAAGPHDRAD